MSTIHDCKITTTEAFAIHSGDKPYIIFQNGYLIQKNDLIRFEVYRDSLARIDEKNELNNALYRVTFVSSEPGIEKNYVAVGIEPYTDELEA